VCGGGGLGRAKSTSFLKEGWVLVVGGGGGGGVVVEEGKGGILH